MLNTHVQERSALITLQRPEVPPFSAHKNHHKSTNDPKEREALVDLVAPVPQSPPSKSPRPKDLPVSPSGNAKSVPIQFLQKEVESSASPGLPDTQSPDQPFDFPNVRLKSTDAREQLQVEKAAAELANTSFKASMRTQSIFGHDGPFRFGPATPTPHIHKRKIVSFREMNSAESKEEEGPLNAAMDQMSELLLPETVVDKSVEVVAADIETEKHAIKPGQVACSNETTPQSKCVTSSPPPFDSAYNTASNKKRKRGKTYAARHTADNTAVKRRSIVKHVQHEIDAAGDDAHVTPNNRDTTPGSTASSSRSLRSDVKAERSSEPTKIVQRIFFASTVMDYKRTSAMAFLTLNGVAETTDILKASILCVGSGPFKKTGNTLIAMIKGLDIVIDTWLTDSKSKQELLDTVSYLPDASTLERQFNFDLRSVLTRSPHVLKGLLPGFTVCFTKGLKTDLGNSTYKDLTKVAMALGGKIKIGLPSGSMDTDGLLIIGTTNDLDAANVGRLGCKFYNKDLLTWAAIQGKLDLDDAHFQLHVPIKEESSSSS